MAMSTKFSSVNLGRRAQITYYVAVVRQAFLFRLMGVSSGQTPRGYWGLLFRYLSGQTLLPAHPKYGGKQWLVERVNSEVAGMGCSIVTANNLVSSPIGENA